MSTTAALLHLPLLSVARGPLGPVLGKSEGRVNDWPFDVTLTASEIHFAFADRDGPRFAVDLNGLAKEAANSIETLITGKRKMV